MKVKELVKQLRAMPQDAEVIVADDVTVMDSVETVCSEIDGVSRDVWTLGGDHQEGSLVIIVAFPDDDGYDLDDFERSQKGDEVVLRRTEANARRLWRKYVRTHGLPPGCPARPDIMYAGRGWDGWCGFMDTLSSDGEAAHADPDGGVHSR